jgi:phosphatidyl-myo-inositol dimannoside synthase
MAFGSRAPSVQRPVGRVGLATITRRPGADGVAHVGRLLHCALAEIEQRDPWTVDLDPRGARPAADERVRFTARIAAAQIARRFESLLYNHVGIAAAHRLVPAGLRTPYAVFVHGVEVWGAAMTPARARVLRDASLIVANSHYTARRLMREAPSLGTVVACPLALLADGATSASADAALLAAVRPRSALIAARMSASERYKGHDELIAAWPAVRARVPDAQLVIVGGGDDAARIADLARVAGLDRDAVLIGGRVSDATLGALFDRTRAFAMPSRGEGFGIVYLQAMRAGRPCLGATDDAAGDVIVHGETGLLVAQRDAHAVTDALVTLLGDDDIAARMGAAGRQRYEREFTFERFVHRLRAVLQSPRAATEAA